MNARRNRTGRLVALAAAALLGGCDDDQGGEAQGRYRSPLGDVTAAEQPPGDPAAGYRALVNAPYVSCGIPYDAWRRLAPAVDPADTIPGREGRNAELPYDLTAHVNADGVEVVSSNCLTCHAQRIDGEVVVGLGNAFADFTRDPRRLVLQAGAYVQGEAETRAWAHWAERIEGIAPYIRTRTIGANPATNLTWALMAHRDPETLAWSETPLIEPPQEEPLPISVPPWWGMKKKGAMFYTTIGRGDHSRFMLLASMLCIDDREELEGVMDYAADVRAWIASLDAPAWPWEIDAAKAETGREVYGRECRRCHGDEESYPDRVYGLDEVGTDPAYARAATDGSRDRFYEWLARSPYGDADSAGPAPGYVAPPLDGVWATAPYLHNGSVPTLAALLDSGARPAFWRIETDPPRYDREAVGWAYERLEAGQEAETDPDARSRIYDATLPGYGAGGHAYGDALGEAERAALLEYLKTL
ncbi:hypothetical protein P2H44_04070 [Albimonas sp. CAU 1670]|uniref:c-type cytochrome n=1 Tax=Albimonas sp. CAU 1670 TaxID=3032599 RepID=UPI0023DB42F7|nr:hypothetical protein [Albimonas sp. CAU 1670]MDF2231719.1 hypothetical protein [Albimonas sp. CAU 1670]